MSKIIESLRSKGFNADEVVEAIESLEARVAELQAELLEQCRVNGAGSEREAKLMTRVADLEAKLQTISWRVHINGPTYVLAETIRKVLENNDE
jgi:hypothetical protein